MEGERDGGRERVKEGRREGIKRVSKCMSSQGRGRKGGEGMVTMEDGYLANLTLQYNTAYYSILQSLTQHLEPWMQSSDELERIHAMTCILDLLKAYLTHSDENEVRNTVQQL